MNLVSRNPFTGEIIKEFEPMNLGECVQEIQKSRKAFRYWEKAPIQERTGYFRAISKRLREQQRTFAETITREMGKPIGQSLAEIENAHGFSTTLRRMRRNSSKRSRLRPML